MESLATQLEAVSLTSGVALAIAFLGGLVAGFGPCVLPLLPAVLGVVARQSYGGDLDSMNLRRTFTLALAFVWGTALTFAALGALAGTLGAVAFGGGWANWILALVSAVLGLQLLGVIELSFFSRIGLTRVSFDRFRMGGVPGALLIGSAFGLVASPCATPVLVAVATLAASQQSALGGALLLFVYGLGKGVPVLAVGIAGGLLPGFLAKGERASVILTRIGGIALIGVALWLVWTA